MSLQLTARPTRPDAGDDTEVITPVVVFTPGSPTAGPFVAPPSATCPYTPGTPLDHAGTDLAEWVRRITPPGHHRGARTSGGLPKGLTASIVVAAALSATAAWMWFGPLGVAGVLGLVLAAHAAGWAATTLVDR